MESLSDMAAITTCHGNERSVRFSAVVMRDRGCWVGRVSVSRGVGEAWVLWHPFLGARAEIQDIPVLALQPYVTKWPD